MAINPYDKWPQLDIKPLDFGQLMQAQQYINNKAEARQDKSRELLGKAYAALPIQGGYATQKLAKEYNDQVINPLLNTYADKIAKNEPMNLWYPQYMKDVAAITSDPVYTAIKEDEAYKPAVQDQMKEPDFQYSLQDYYDPQAGFGQVGAQDILKGWSTGAHYNMERPKDVNSDFKDYYSQIRAQLSKEYGAPVKSFEYDAEGNPIAVLETVYGEQTKKIDRNRVRDIITPMVMNNFPALMGSKQSLRYNAKYYNRANPNFQYNELSAIDDITNGFLGEFEERVEMQPRVTKTMFPKKKEGAGNLPGGLTEAELLDNPVDIALLQAQANPEGTSSPDLRTASVLLNGSQPEEKDNTFIINLAGSPTLLKLNDQVAPQQDQDASVKINVYGRLKDLISQEEDKVDLKGLSDSELEKMFPEYFTPEAKQQGWELHRSFGFPQFRIKEGMFGGVKDMKTISTRDVAAKRVTEKDLSTGRFKNSKYDLLQKEYSNKYNIDISDPTFAQEVESYALDPNQEILSDISVGLEKYSGSVKFMPNRNNALFRGNDGNFWIQGTTELSREAVAAMFGGEEGDAGDKMEQAIELGIIQPATMDEKLNKPATYIVPISKQVYEDLPGATQRYWSGPGTTEFYQKQAAAQVDRSKKVYERLKTEKQAFRVVKPLIEKDPAGFAGDLISKINTLTGTPEEKAQAVQSLNAYINAAKKAKAEGDFESLNKIYGALYQIYSGLQTTGSATPGSERAVSGVGTKPFQQGR